MTCTCADALCLRFSRSAAAQERGEPRARLSCRGTSLHFWPLWGTSAPPAPHKLFPPDCTHCCFSGTSGSAGNGPAAQGLWSRTWMDKVFWLKVVWQLCSALGMLFRHLTGGRRPVGSRRGEVANSLSAGEAQFPP